MKLDLMIFLLKLPNKRREKYSKNIPFISFHFLLPNEALDRRGFKYHWVGFGSKYIKFIFILIKLFVFSL